MLTILLPKTPFPAEFPKGAVLLIDKPLGWTSFGVVNKVRYLLSRRVGVKRLKVGHAGTLDPLATGLLVLCTGDYTKKIESLQGLEKEYTGTFTFGATTASFDLEKPADQTFSIEQLNDSFLQKTAAQFIGDIEQIPPMYSAVKVEGKRLYKNARTGQEVELSPRKVHIETFELGPLRPSQASEADTSQSEIISKKGASIHQYPDYPNGLQCDFRVVCGKGTYIRSLAFELGEALGTGAYLSSLRRTRNGDLSIENAWTMEDFSTWVKS